MVHVNTTGALLILPLLGVFGNALSCRVYRLCVLKDRCEEGDVCSELKLGLT